MIWGRRPRLLTIVDECAELLQPTGLKSEEGKSEDACKQEIVGLIKSITQLGRSSGMHIIVCPLRLSTIIPTTEGYVNMQTIQPGDFVFNRMGQPEEVLSVSDVKMSDGMYEMKLYGANSGKTFTIGADREHRFPVMVRGVEEVAYMPRIEALWRQAYNLEIVGRDGNWKVQSIELVPDEPVRCIEVDDLEHMFLITDRVDGRWCGGRQYPYPAILTCNTQRNDAALPYWLPLTVKRNGESIDITWEQLQIGDTFLCGSQCIAIGEWFYEPCYDIIDQEGTQITASASHTMKMVIEEPEELDRVNGLEMFELSRQARQRLGEEDEEWMVAEDLHKAIESGYWLYNPNSGMKITKVIPHGKFEAEKVRCIQTNSGYYDIRQFRSHNSIIP